ncbi:hypothetical protein AAFF_G00250490 [Aldrovandia affinis]|uniref:Uncharacterized protein n=1 Tax=Aldrovandia affinis TaxID=143900 RepID=A0AAD7RDF9_9TELE|nr:hypothetical protein AAFF_G00250490 [Aldrovandia affinis]
MVVVGGGGVRPAGCCSAQQRPPLVYWGPASFFHRPSQLGAPTSTPIAQLLDRTAGRIGSTRDTRFNVPQEGARSCGVGQGNVGAGGWGRSGMAQRGRRSQGAGRAARGVAYWCPQSRAAVTLALH